MPGFVFSGILINSLCIFELMQLVQCIAPEIRIVIENIFIIILFKRLKFVILMYVKIAFLRYV